MALSLFDNDDPGGAARDDARRRDAASALAHELGNPLAAIKATLQSIEGEAEAAGLGDPIRAASGEIDRLDRIIAQLLGGGLPLRIRDRREGRT